MGARGSHKKEFSLKTMSLPTKSLETNSMKRGAQMTEKYIDSCDWFFFCFFSDFCAVTDDDISYFVLHTTEPAQSAASTAAISASPRCRGNQSHEAPFQLAMHATLFLSFFFIIIFIFLRFGTSDACLCLSVGIYFLIPQP